MLLRLDAHIYCDGCGNQFVVEIEDDSLLGIARGAGLDAMVDEAIRTCQAKGGGFVSVRYGRMLCVDCTFATVCADVDETTRAVEALL